MLLLLLACSAPPPDDTSGDTGPDSAPAEPHLTYLAADNALSEVRRVDSRGTGGWITELPSPLPRDLSVVGDEVLVSTDAGAVWLSLATGEVLGEIAGFSEVQTARPLANGDVLLGAQDGDEVVFTEVDASGTVVSTLPLAGYSDLRLVRVLDDGSLLFPAGRDGWHVFEVDPDGSEAWSAPLPGKGYLAERLADGTTLATTGEDVEVVALDPGGAIARTWGGRAADPDLDDDAFFSGFSVLDADHVLVANWHGHDLTQEGPHVILYGADGTRMWEDAPEGMIQCTNVLVLEAVDVAAIGE